jgi:EpsI family protein
MPPFLSSRPMKILTVALLIQCMAFYAMANRSESTPVVSSLASFPNQLGDWTMVREGVIEKEIMEVLRADDAITRWYAKPNSSRAADLFIAYFNTQKTGKAPHSPKNCLPGAGWLPIINDRITIPIQGHEPVEANRYVVARGNSRSLVLYWYQSSRRTVASEYKAKVFTVLDSIRYNRSDTAVVKVTLPMGEEDVDQATAIATGFVQSFFGKLLPYFPA